MGSVDYKIVEIRREFDFWFSPQSRSVQYSRYDGWGVFCLASESGTTQSAQHSVPCDYRDNNAATVLEVKAVDGGYVPLFWAFSWL